MPRTRLVPLVSITVDKSIQQRESTSALTVAEYAQDMQRGDTFPPIVLYQDGDTYWLSEGFHRVEAADTIGLEKISAEVRPGKRKDAIVNACQSNQGHGLRRTNADKRRAVKTLLELFPKKPDRAIAEMAGVEHHLVATVRGLGESPKANLKPILNDPSKPQPKPKTLAPIEEALLADRELIEADPKEVAEELGVKPIDVESVQKALEDNSREYKDGRKRYMPVFTKKTEPTYPANELFDKLSLAISSYHDQLAQRYADHTEDSFDYDSLWRSESWNDSKSEYALACLRETRKLITRIERSLEKHVKSSA